MAKTVNFKNVNGTDYSRFEKKLTAKNENGTDFF